MTEQEKHPGGRPRLYDDPETFADKVDAYFAEVETKGKKPTLAGLCLSMGFIDKESFSNYANYGEEFSRTVKRAKLMMEDDRQQLLLSKERFTPGVALDLQNNHGWKNKSETELSGPNGGPIQSQSVVMGVKAEDVPEDVLRWMASNRVENN